MGQPPAATPAPVPVHSNFTQPGAQTLPPGWFPQTVYLTGNTTPVDLYSGMPQLQPLGQPTVFASGQSAQQQGIPGGSKGSAAGPSATVDNEKKENGENGNGKDDKKEDDKKKEDKYLGAKWKLEDSKSTFMRRLYSYYYDQFFPPTNPPPAEPPAPRRALPSPWSAPPFPGDEYQGYPLIGVPWEFGNTAVMQALYGGPNGQQIKDSRITFEGWATAGVNFSNARNTNVPTAYWDAPNSIQLDQLIFKFERVPDTVQTDHIDWGFRSVALYGEDYRYTMAGGWGSAQLYKHNLLYGWDPVEQYVNAYIPGFLGGTDIRLGRWIACPDIETQYSVNNYMASHSILFTYDTYTNTGLMLSQKLNDQWMVQFALTAGTDMAPWYPGALPTFGAGVRWVSKDNNDSVYTWLNQCNNAQFRHFEQYGQPLGHDNFNYIVSTWTHTFSEAVHTSTEAYFMWQYNAEVGGTPSAGPIQPYGGGGGNGTLLPGISLTYGVLNYTMFGVSERDYITVRNEWYRDERGMRTGYAGTYTSNSIGLSHQFNDVMMIRPEIGFYRNWTENAFDGGTKRNLLMTGFDITWRF